MNTIFIKIRNPINIKSAEESKSNIGTDVRRLFGIGVRNDLYWNSACNVLKPFNTIVL